MRTGASEESFRFVLHVQSLVYEGRWFEWSRVRCLKSRLLQANQLASNLHTRKADYPRAWSRFTAALIRARWVKAWGKFPKASPDEPISSAKSPRWLA